MAEELLVGSDSSSSWFRKFLMAHSWLAPCWPRALVQIPKGFSKLTNLAVLHLEGNRLTAKGVPHWARTTERTLVGFHNGLTADVSGFTETNGRRPYMEGECCWVVDGLLMGCFCRGSRVLFFFFPLFVCWFVCWYCVFCFV